MLRLLMYFYTCILCATACMWTSEDTFQVLFLSFYCISPADLASDSGIWGQAPFFGPNMYILRAKHIALPLLDHF